jgi:hypothetical protein
MRSTPTSRPRSAATTARTVRPGSSCQRANCTLIARTAGTLSERARPGLGNHFLTWAFGWERVTGIEPALSAWEADVLPLNYTRAHCSSSPSGGSLAVLAQTSYRKG